MSTPIEIVREQWDWMRADYTNGAIAPHGWEEYDTALAAVLRDAERFAALELAIRLNRGRVAIELVCERCQYGDETATLAELADRLRKEAK